jgi:2-polyprenyl-3-methyl-5-hydroxy-6-metoxy-1,4-benzoquinol methylase
MEKEFSQQVEGGERFQFGKNWQAFLTTINEERIEIACQSLKYNIDCTGANNKTFIDIGCGSGLFSLAARRLGFTVYSFDFDTQSVKCAECLKDKYYKNDASWTVREASVLDPAFLSTLGQFDVVYSWGVLHHTGQMWNALTNIAPLVKDKGFLFISIYNEQGLKSKIWHTIKRIYNANVIGRSTVVAFFVPFYTCVYLVADLLSLKKPSKRYAEYKKKRGMAMYYDWIDWVGGFPFEVATPKQLFDFYKAKGFSLSEITTTNRSGCNEMVFQKTSTQ